MLLYWTMSSPIMGDVVGNGGRWYVCYFTGQYLSNLHSCHTSEIEAKSDFTAQEDFFPALRTTPGIYPTDGLMGRGQLCKLTGGAATNRERWYFSYFIRQDLQDLQDIFLVQLS